MLVITNKEQQTNLDTTADQYIVHPNTNRKQTKYQMLPDPSFSNFMYSFDIFGLVQLVGFNEEIKSQLISVIYKFLLRLAVINRYDFLLYYKAICDISYEDKTNRSNFFYFL